MPNADSQVQPNHYATLGVAETATPDQIRLAYRRAIRICHPDHNHNDPAAAALFRELTSAYKILRDPEQRMSFDASLGMGHSFRPWYSPESGTGESSHVSDPALKPFETTAQTLASNGLSASEIASSLIETECPYEAAWEIAWQARHDQMARQMKTAEMGPREDSMHHDDGHWHPHRNTLWEKLRFRVSRIFN
ncbi:MAG: J domain-containing protein [Burkholderiaceae bacterium]